VLPTVGPPRPPCGDLDPLPPLPGPGPMFSLAESLEWMPDVLSVIGPMPADTGYDVFPLALPYTYEPIASHDQVASVPWLSDYAVALEYADHRSVELTAWELQDSLLESLLPDLLFAGDFERSLDVAARDLAFATY